MQTSSTLNKWLGILFLYSDLMSSVMKLASESKKGEHTNPCHPGVTNHCSFFSPLPKSLLYRVLYTNNPMILLWRKHLQHIRPHATGWFSVAREAGKKVQGTPFAVMNYLMIIPLVFWDTHLPPKTCR